MKKLLIIIIFILLISGCKKQSTTILCTSNGEIPGMSRTIEYYSEDNVVNKIVVTFKVDVTAKDMGENVAMVMDALMQDAPFAEKDIDGLEFEFTSQGTVVTEVMSVDLTKVAKPVLEELYIFDKKIIDGNDESYTLDAQKLKESLEKDDRYYSSCEIINK